jgi:hypothetical protein
VRKGDGEVYLSPESRNSMSSSLGWGNQTRRESGEERGKAERNRAKAKPETPGEGLRSSPRLLSGMGYRLVLRAPLALPSRWGLSPRSPVVQLDMLLPLWLTTRLILHGSGPPWEGCWYTRGWAALLLAGTVSLWPRPPGDEPEFWFRIAYAGELP